jgi:hypothetical protein
MHLNHGMKNDSTLHVIGVVSNPSRFQSRVRLAREWIARMEATANVQLHLVETAHGDHHHEVTRDSHANHLQLRTDHELWTKESMINLGICHLLPSDWRYVAWVDADVSFSNPDWAIQTIHQLQRRHIVQPWSECVDLGPKGEALQLHRSFASRVNGGHKLPLNPKDPYAFGHMGYATAATREFIENTRGLIDWAILGAGDSHMAYATIGKVDHSINGRAAEGYKRLAREWQFHAHRLTNGHWGYVPGVILHHWHGTKKSRQYQSRWQILVDHKFDPTVDLAKDSQGLYKLVGKPHLQEAVRRYFDSRNEDSVDTE